jgi:hypothetical protein
MTTYNRETRENWMNGFIELARPHFEAAGNPLPLNIRVSISLPSTGINTRGKNQIRAQCFSPEASADGHYEILVNPMTETDAASIAVVLSHELCHAALGNEVGHTKPFQILAKALGMKGPFTEANADAEWFDWASPVLDELGPMDFAQMSADFAKPPRKKSATYLRKVECPDCEWLAQVTLSHVRPHTHLNCPTPDCDGMLIVHYHESDAEMQETE